MELSQFQQPKITVESFDLQDMKQDVTLNRRASAQLAAGEIMLSESPTVEDFRSTRESLMSQEGRKNFILKQEQRRVEILSSFEEEITGILLDPEIPDEQKKMYVEGIKNSPENFKPSTIDIMAEEAIQAMSAPNETEQESFNRLEFVDMIEEVHRFKRTATANLNSYTAEKNPDLVNMAVDLAELLLPYGEWANQAQLYNEFVDGDKWLMGSMKEELFSVAKKIPYNKRAEFNEKLLDFISTHDGVILPDGNDLLALDNLQQMMVEEDYSNLEKWFDNTVSLLEATGVLSLVGAGVKVVGKGLQKSSKFSKVAVRTEVVPTSPSQIIKDVNPEKSRNIHDMTATTEGDEAAEALYGTNKTEAMAKDIAPEPELEPGEIPNKVSQRDRPGPEFDEPEDIKELRKTDGQTYISETEQSKVYDDVVRNFNEVEGMKPHKESTVIRTNDDGTLGINMIYRPTDAGFKTAAQAIENAKFAFRRYGLGEEHFTLYRRSGDKWVVTSQKLLAARAELRAEFTRKKQKIPAELKDIDYAIGINYNYKVRPEDIQTYDLLSTGRIFGFLPSNLLDRITLPGGKSLASGGQGSLTQNFLDAASVLHPQIVNPASIAVDKSVALKKAYVETFNGFTKKYKKLSKERRMLMSDYIHKANFEGLKFDPTDLRARGFNEDEIGTLREWRRANDIMFHATNDDMVKTLMNKGYKFLVHEASDTKLVGKPMKRGSVSGAKEFWNPVTNKVENLGDNVDEFYEGGGTLVKLSEPIKIGENWVDVVRSDEAAGSTYLRSLKEGDQVLAYRDGYYPVMYDANFFIYKTIKKPDGTTFDKVVASAKNKADATRLVEEMRMDDPDAIAIDFRPDRRMENVKQSEFDEMGWSLGVNSGISTQRVRGERLADYTGGMRKVGESNLHDPLEAVAAQISTLSKRIATRDYLDTTKRRWVDNYAEKLGLEKDRTGEYRFPTSVSQITGKGTTDAQTVADARTMFNYIYSLENGYINLIDETFKGTLNFGADLLSGMKFTKGEEFLRGWGQTSVTSQAKGAVFKMYLAANPVRQLVIQAHQSVQLNAINPKYVSGGGLIWDLYRLRRAQRGYTGDEEAVEMYKQLKNSGMMDAVDENNLVRRDALRLADLSVGQKLSSAAGAPVRWSQVVGFDTAEQFVLVTSWLTHRNMAKVAGKNVSSARVIDEVGGQARAFTYAMNRAGDMPYNQNSLNIIAQFLQVPHKAFLQPLTNRSLSPKDRLKLLTWNGVMYGVPSGIVGSMLYDTFEPGPVRDSIENGLEHVLLNQVFSWATGEEQSIEWGDLAPSDLHGTSDFFVGLFTTPPGEQLANSPAGSLVMGQNPRLTEALKTAARWTHLRDDYDDPELDTKFSDVAIAAASLFSGYSNAAKARYAMKTRQKMSSLGNITDYDVTKFEAVMQVAGFRTTTEESSRLINEELYGDSNFDIDNDVKVWYNEWKRMMARRGRTVKERDMDQRILTEGLRAFEDHPIKFQESLFNIIKNDVEKNEYNIVEKVMKEIGWRDRAGTIELIEMLPDSNEKRILLESVNKLGEMNDG